MQSGGNMLNLSDHLPSVVASRLPRCLTTIWIVAVVGTLVTSLVGFFVFAFSDLESKRAGQEIPISHKHSDLHTTKIKDEKEKERSIEIFMNEEEDDKLINTESILLELDQIKSKVNVIKEHTKSTSIRNKFLIAWPTIPVSYKGSDTRALNAIEFLTEIGFEVDLIYWRDFATELNDANHDDSQDRQKLYETGVHSIMGPYDKISLSQSQSSSSSKNFSSSLSQYFGFIFWIWPDGPYLECLVDFVNYIKSQNTLTHILSAVDDLGIAARDLYGDPLENKHHLDLQTVQDFLIQFKRPPDLLGVDSYDLEISSNLSSSFNGKLYRSTYFLHLEMYLYVMSDRSIGLNYPIAQYLEKLVPGTKAHILSYVSPIQPQPQQIPSSQKINVNDNDINIPFEERQGYLFFGYDNHANQKALEWFYQNVFPSLPVDQPFHIAGMITANIPQFCNCPPKNVEKNATQQCQSTQPNVICHGALPEEDLQSLIQNSLVAINPVLEPSGVATKICRALALGTPVVVSDLDGTFPETIKTKTSPSLQKENVDVVFKHGAMICKALDHNCIISSLKIMLTNSVKWNQASQSGPTYISRAYGMNQYKRDWMNILESLFGDEAFIRIIVDGDAKSEGESMAAQNWHIANILNSFPEFHVSVMGTLEPPILGVNQVNPPKRQLLKSIPKYSWKRLLFPGRYKTMQSPFETGFQADILIRQKWPPSMTSLPLKFCGPGCRVVQILPWEFGALPKSWMNSLTQNVDWLWAPSEYNRKIYDTSGFDPSRSTVVSAGIDCESLFKSVTQSILHDGIVSQDSNFLSKDNNGSASHSRPVHFIFSGGYIPRKGVDTILETWDEAFCNNREVKLILHTSYELGYSDDERDKMNLIISKCSNIEWMHQTWLSREEHIRLMRSADIYLAPFRSEGFGLPIAEAIVLGLSVIVSVGGTSADDFVLGNEFHSNHVQGQNREIIYPVPVTAQECTHEPCRGDQLCVFSPCKKMFHKKEFRCACETLVQKPSWFEVNGADLKKQMLQAYQDVKSDRIESDGQVVSDIINASANMKVCWSNLRETYHENVISVLENERKRNIPNFTVNSPRMLRRRDQQKMYIEIFISSLIFIWIIWSKRQRNNVKRCNYDIIIEWKRKFKLYHWSILSKRQTKFSKVK